MKSLYYLRSKSVQRAAFAGAEDKVEAEVDPNQPDLFSRRPAPTTTSAWPASDRPRASKPPDMRAAPDPGAARSLDLA